MSHRITLTLVLAAMSIATCQAMEEDTAIKPAIVKQKPFVHEAELDVASITHTFREEYTDVQHNGQAYEIARNVLKGGPLNKDRKTFVFFTAHRWGIGAARKEYISKQAFEKAKTTPNAKRYVKQEYYADLLTGSWVSTCRTNDGTANTFESRRQVGSRYNPDVDRSEAAFKVVQLAYFEGLSQRPKPEETKKD